ncbi:MAG: AmmeMemoRadiSam system radical SAM enzyme [Deltaproteobacteria bacterium]|nr:AmmeMemoRadiSam system radical SAM enzyme [Deltaproteobacteria bacterium]
MGAISELFSLSPQAGEAGNRKAMFFKKTEGNLLQCELCFRRCLIPEGQRGFCRVRENRKGELQNLVYGRPVGLQIDPIELEPMYHMVPGHKNLCIYTASCNFRCKHCQNWSISQSAPEQIRALKFTPKEIVEETLKQGCQSISHSINEPTVFFEMMYEVARMAKEKGLLTLCHTNGGIARAPMIELLKFLDGVTVDLKSFSPKFYQDISEAKLEPVLETLKTIRESGKHLEIVNLIIPTLNDKMDDIRKMCRWIVQHLGKETPIHFTRFSPQYKMTHLPYTPIKTLEEAMEMAKSEGMKYVYVGNVVGHPANSTYCPKCGKKVIERTHFILLKNQVKNGLCPFCKEKIPGVWSVA